MMTPTQEPLAGDLLEGAVAIAKFMGWTVRRTYHIHRTGGWPMFNDGNILTARRSSLRAYVEQREREAMQRGRAGRQLAEPDARAGTNPAMR
jgi:hypothetical protein